MNGIGVTLAALRDVHDAIREDLADLDPGALEWQPSPGVNHIGFLLWHMVRDEDHVMSAAVRRGPTTWDRGGWAARLGVAEGDQGTGFDTARAAAVRYRLEAFREYMEEVFRRSEETLVALDDGLLDGEVRWPGGSLGMAAQLHGGMIGHHWVHLGEIRMLRGLGGWRFRE